MHTTAMGSRIKPAAMGYRVMQLVVGIACMVAIANLQYGWTLFVDPINQKYQWGRPAIQLAFTIFILMETWLVPVEGWLIDKFGLRTMFLLAGVLVGLGWVTNAYASSLTMLYVAAVLGGIGGGIVYGGSVGNALKWFPDHRGLAAGLTAGGYGMGAALTVVPIANMIKAQGYESAFFTFGIAQGLVVLVLALIFRAPRPGEVPNVPSQRVQQTTQDSSPTQMLKTPIFWLLYVMFTLMATGGLMATAQLASVAKDYKIGEVPVTLLGLTLAALPFALSIDRVLNGLTRPFFGWVSDRLGRENTMFTAFSLEGIGIILLLLNAHNPVAFVILSGVVFFAWGEIYSLFPALCSDLFGKQYATANYGLLYTAKGTAALLVPISAWIVTMSGSWAGVFITAASFDIIAALLALFVLKPMRISMLSGAPPMDKRQKFLIGGCGMIIAGIISLGSAALMNAELQKIQMQFSRPEVQLRMRLQDGGKMSDIVQQGRQTGYNWMTAAIILGLLLTAGGGILIAVRPAPRSETSVSPPTIQTEKGK